MVKTELRVIYGDTDQMGVVYYANYLRFFEAARNEYLRAHGARYRDVETTYGIRLPVVEAHVNYKQPARYDDLIVVEAEITKLGRASARFEYRVLRGAEVLATGHTVHACIDASGALQKLPHEFVARLEAARVL
jgi:acyl-CoA thioester hydrolase